MDGMGRVRAGALLALALLALVCLQCGPGAQTQGAATPTDPPVPQTLGCVSDNTAAQTEIIQFHSPKDGLVRGALVGRGRVGVVLAHQASGSLCQWLPYAARLRDQGREVLAFTFAGLDLAGEVGSAAAELARRGVGRTLLVGASMGGTASLVAAASAGRGVVGVASLSGPARYIDMDAEAAARRLTIPALFMVAEGDVSAFVADAHRLYAACGSRQKQLEIRPGSDHGVDLVGSGGGDQVLEQWMVKVAGP